MERELRVRSLWYCAVAITAAPTAAWAARSLTRLDQYAHQTGAREVSKTVVRTTRAGNKVHLVSGIGTRVDPGQAGSSSRRRARSQGDRFVTTTPDGWVLSVRRSQAAADPASARQLIDLLAVLAHGDHNQPTTGLGLEDTGLSQFQMITRYLRSHADSALPPGLHAELMSAIRAGRERARTNYLSAARRDTDLARRNLVDLARWHSILERVAKH
jgi:hypothetical protein